MNIESEFSEMLMLKAQLYFSKLGIPVVEKYAGTWDNMKLERFISMLRISGALEGYFLFSVDDSLAFALVNLFLVEKLSETEVLLYADKVVAEIVNTIAGNALTDRDDVNVFIHVPLIYRAKEVSLKLHAELPSIQSAATSMGAFQCAYIRSDELWLDF